MSEKESQRQNFLNKFSPDKINQYNGLKLLKILAYPRTTDNNLEIQFGDLFERDFISLKNDLECYNNEFFGNGNADWDTNFLLAYRDGSWNKFRKKISNDEAIFLAEEIKRELIIACSYLDNNNFNDFYKFVTTSKLKLFNKVYTHKYFHIVYPKYISFFHAESFQRKYLKKLKGNWQNHYSLEKYFYDKDNNYNMIEKDEYLNKLDDKPTPTPQNTGELTVPNDNNKDNIPLNQILYGPPGTGKTYNTVVKAMEIIDGKKYTDNKGNLLEGVEYDVLKKSFDDAKSKHRIEFITFHQSYSYEEFVEGIKPYIPKDIWKIDKDEIDKQFKKQKKGQKNILPDVKYIGQKGIFKDVCDRAAIVKPSFDNIKEYFNNHYEEYDYKTPEEMPFKIKEIKEKAITIIPENGKTPFDLQYEHIEQLKNIDKDAISQDDLKAYCENENTTLNSYTSWYGSYYPAIVNTFKKIEKKLKQKKYVLIIDEINRGNISKIFGELITLIEEDKRKKVYEDGKKYNTLEVTLPYSQDTFSVPNNLFIIGTMNTADRSIANVDIALRRRFKFVEMMPQKDIVADYGCNFDKVFDKLNKRIAALLDRDHQIGHSYFIKDKYKDADVNTLKDIWFDSVMPLLNEYFYGDWEKLQAILGKVEDEKKSFIVSNKTDNLFAPTDENPCDDNYYDFREKSAYNNIENFIAAMEYAFPNDFVLKEKDNNNAE